MTAQTDQFKGKVKETVGVATDRPDLEREGKADQMGAKVKDAAAAMKEKIDGAVDAVKERINHRH